MKVDSDEILQLVAHLVRKFQSPCGEVVMKGRLDARIESDEMFQSPCGEVVMKEWQLEPALDRGSKVEIDANQK